MTQTGSAGRVTPVPCRWTWVRSFVAIGVLLLGGAACGDEGGPAEVPTLGRDIGFNGAVGFGEIRPQEIYYGGVPTGRVFDIEWESWGESKAVGHGTSYYDNGHGSAGSLRRPATVVAYRLGNCRGLPAYLDVRWFFEGEGDQIDLSGDSVYDICDGPD